MIPLLRAFFLLTLVTGSVAALAQAQLLDLRSAVHPDKIRVVVDLSEAARYRVGANDTRRQVELAIYDSVAADSFTIDQRLFRGTAITAVSLVDAAAPARLQIGLAEPMRNKSFALVPEGDRGHRIVLDLYPLDTAQDESANGTGPAATAAAASSAEPSAASPDAAASNAAVNAGAAAATSAASDPETGEPEEDRIGWQFSGTWEHEWALETGDADAQKFESLVEPRVDADFPSGMRVTAIARLRLDGVGDLGPDASRPDNYSSVNGPWANNEYAGFDLRELYLDAQTGDILWRLGKQQVVWGEADGIKIMDVVNPQSFREFILDDFDDSRIPLWSVNAELLLGDAGSLQVLWIPDTTYHELAEPGTPFEATSPLLVPRAPPGLPTTERSADRPDNPFSDSDAGLRFSTFLGGWDITLNYLYHYQDTPVPYQALEVVDGGLLGVLLPEYERNHLSGATLSNVFGAFTLRSELVYSTDTFHVSSDLDSAGIRDSADFSSVVGVDWQYDASDTLVSAQWFQSHLLDHDSSIFRSETEHTLSLLYQRNFNYDTWTLEALGLYSVDRGDRWLNLRLSHMFRDNIEVWVGGDFFGGDRDGLFGQFGSADRALLGIEIGF